MRAVGIEPDGFVGHSVGELGCSYMDGCFTAEQVMLAAYYLGRAALETELVKGLMVSVGKSCSFAYISQEYISTCLSVFHPLVMTAPRVNRS
jgi:malonyl CoA-acyl carrier protein transacylase